MTVVAKDPTQWPDNDLATLWRQVGEHLVHGRSRLDARLDRFDTRMDRLEGDVATLKIDLTATIEQLGRLERSTERRFNRVDAQLERLITLVQRDETTPP
jgi:hypothetical protein